jgi:hypothetical protein
MIKLTHEEWFKIYMILDNLDPSQKYHKNFLLFVEYWKHLLQDTMKVYVSASESIQYDPDSDFYQYKEAFLSLDNDEEAISELNKNHLDLIQEVNSLNNEITAIVKSVISFQKILIPRHLVPELDEERMQVLSVLIEGNEDEKN